MSAEKIETLEAALRAAARNDNSSYRLFQKRFFDNKAPGDAKIWDTPRDYDLIAVSSDPEMCRSAYGLCE